MEQSNSGLYPGPLSEAAQKILAVLREQSLRETRRRRRHLYDHRQMERFYGSQRESLAQSSWMKSEEESRDRDMERPWSRPQRSTYYQLSQTPSQTSSCWDSTPQRESAAYNQYSQREYYETPAYQSRQSLSSSQREVTEAAASALQRDGHALSPKRPRSIFECTDTPWKNFGDEFKPSFTLTLSPDVKGPDEVLFPTTAQQNTCKEELSLASRQVLSCFKDHEEASENTSGAQEEQRCTEAWRGGIQLSVRQESHWDVKKLAWEEGTGQKLSLEHVIQDGNKWMVTRHRDGTLLNEARSGMETCLLNTNKTVSFEQSLTPCLVRITDKSLDSDAEGEEPQEKEKVCGNKEQAVRGHCDSPEKKDHSMSCCQADNTEDTGQIGKKTGEDHLTERPPEHCETHGSILSDNVERTQEESAQVIDVETESSTEDGAGTSSEDKMETRQHCCSDIKLTEREHERDDKDVSELPGGDGESGKRDESVLLHVDWKDECTGRRSCCTLTLSQESRAETSTCVHENHQQHDIHETANGSIRGSSSSVAQASARTSPSGQTSSSELGLDLSVIQSNKNMADRTQAPLIPLKEKLEIHHQENAQPRPKIYLPKRPPKWEPPRSLREKNKDTNELKGNQMTSTQPPTEESLSHKFGKILKNLWALKQSQRLKRLKAEESCGSLPANCKPPKCKRAKCDPDQGRNGLKETHTGTSGGELQQQPRTGSLTASLTSDPRVKDSGRMSSEERMQVLAEAEKAKVLVLTLVYQDGTTQLDPEQKLSPPVCGLLVLMKNNLDCSTPEDSLGPNDSLVYLKLEHTPAWAQQHTHLSQERFTRDMLLQVLSGLQLVVCYKAKDLLRTALQVYREDLSWKQVAGCHIQDPHVSAWLLDPANPSSSYQELLQKHLRRPCVTPALGTKKVSQVISGLCLLPWLNTELCSKLQSWGLWELYSCMELKMISVLAAMESHCIHVDKDALKTTSDLLGTKMKQLEQEAHRAAGQIFLLTSNAQLRTVLFEKLCLHERCENKKLPKTVNKQQQSTSEAALLQLQDLHPLPKIILEYRQVHKIKSTFVDGILSCMMSKNYISSTWHQTSVVTGRISAKHPNFQALPRQPLQITRQQHIQGKEEMVTVHPRAMFIPQDGWTFLAADFCQVELRLLAHLSCDPELLRVFVNPQADVFTMLASQWKGMSEDKVTTEDREHAKRIVYSVVYGAGRKRLSGILGVSSEQASRFQDSFLQTYKEVQTFIQRTIQQCHKQGYVLSIMGRRRTLPNIHSPDWGIRMQAERQAVNFVVQGSAADLCKMAMIRIFHLVSSSSSLSARLLAQLHDELLFEVEDSQVEQFGALVRSTMESLQHVDQLGVHLKVPLKVAVSSGKSWGSMSEL